MLLLLLSSPRSGRQHRASLLLLLAAVLLYVASVCAGLPAGSKCPRHIDCAKEGRHCCKARLPPTVGPASHCRRMRKDAAWRGGSTVMWYEEKIT
ncbi:neural proliferation differentiation and control protein 1-like protein [Lates japonicus]|uniref:Neural proliferation differentiation and control protein 1-like protein n=1 Tax=Lates japonicus TaxID=270547 RepID=A0AAD3MHP2_LATJO|nr:neural proliferation differentiation and control protein 1-like protein [Lates japonicus]